MTGRTASAIAAGLAVGVGLTLVAWLAVRPASEPAPAATTAAVATTTTTSAPVWISAHERRLGPTVLVPDSLDVERGQLVLTYDLIDVTPGDPGEERHWLAGPERWTLVTRAGSIPAETFPTSSRSVRFEVGVEFGVDEIVDVRIDSYRVASPVSWPLPLSSRSGEALRIGPELTFRLVQVVEQAENFLVIVEVDAGGAPTDSLTVDGQGRDWVSSSSSMLGSPRWTLDYRGEDLPDPLPLVVRGLEWIEIESPVTVDLSGVLE